MTYHKVKPLRLLITHQMQDTVPKHIEKALIRRRDEIIWLLGDEGLTLREIKFIFEWPVTTQRINQIIINRRSKKNI